MNRLLTSCAAAALIAAPANAAIVNVVATSTEIIGFFNTTGGGAAGADRSGGAGGAGDHLLGNAGGTAFRNLVVTFNPAVYLALANDPNATLVSAQLVMTENVNDTTSGTADIFAYFSAEENSGFTGATPNTGNQGATSGTTGFFGNSGARRGPFGGGAGPDNLNTLYTGGATAVQHTFVSGVDTITLDLAAGGISLADIQTTLANDGTSNSPIMLDSTFPSQIRLQNGFDLELSFDVVPEPSSALLAGLGALGLLRRRR